MPASEIVDFEREFAELVRDLRALPTAAPPLLRERVRALGEPEPRRVHVSSPSLHRSLLVLAPVCLLVIVGAAIVHGLLSSSTNSGGSSFTALPAKVATTPQSRVRGGPVTPGKRAGHGKVVYGPATTTETGALASPDSAAPYGVPTPSPTRHQDYQADLRVRVRDLDALGRQTANAMRVVRELGGYVASVDQSTTAGAPGEVDLVLRVPVAKVETAMIRLSALGTVLEQHVSIVDLEQTLQQLRDRIRSLRVRIVRLTAALQQPGLSPDVRLALQFQLDDAKRNLARATGSNRATLRQAALSRIGLTLTTQKAVAEKKHHRSRIAHAASNAVDFLAGAGAVALLVLIVISPLLVVAALWWYGARTWRRREERRLLAEA
jgi:Domain of unknown function (DUF4349)